MKTFFIFKLNKEYSSIAIKTPYNIYLLLFSIYKQNKKNLYKAYNLFDEICLSINRDFFNYYIYNTLNILEGYTKYRYIHMYNDYFTGEVSKITINNSHIKLKSNKDENVFIEKIKDIKDLFICDFDNNYYIFTSKKRMKTR
ncbi:MAG: sporulation inhibitor of replication protein SirA [Bacilli bacterium]|nr:sporulation inhibitor of replication protein SirA [Bacilli bacterium]